MSDKKQKKNIKLPLNYTEPDGGDTCMTKVHEANGHKILQKSANLHSKQRCRPLFKPRHHVKVAPHDKVLVPEIRFDRSHTKMTRFDPLLCVEAGMMAPLMATTRLAVVARHPDAGQGDQPPRTCTADCNEALPKQRGPRH